MKQRKPREVTGLGLFGKYCPVCGMKVQKNESLNRFGEYFCSEDHMNRYVDQVQRERLERPQWQNSRGGCC